MNPATIRRLKTHRAMEKALGRPAPTGTPPLHHHAVVPGMEGNYERYEGGQKYSKVEVMFHDDDRVVHLMQFAHGGSGDLQGIVFPLPMLGPIRRALTAIAKAEGRK